MRGHFQSEGHAARRRLWIACLMLLLTGSGLRSTAEIIDRIVVTVNRHPILQSEWEEAVGFECLSSARSLAAVTPEDRRQTLERLIDQQLIAEQMRASSFVPATDEEIAARVRELRESVLAWKTDEGWSAALNAYGLSDDDVVERTAVQVNLLRYLDLRFRQQVHISPRAIENYYREQLLPQLRRAGAAEPPLQQVTGRIEQLLVEQRLNELQSQWVRTLRLQADIQVR
jgi:peptidyl-prolyl cis-trans isomerase SurA